ncbi:4-phosphopantetheinyl transferase family protein [Mucilaginibacter corticis]|uniref:4-phosphopantetheinyl transferase family protein n=1 Tax=Mucilaginibacter corticis TaxID=2597670 RepID=A0A556MHI9_9SPHI|nr:4'-phosphopantetheinyl transferase superfamily protein [Mucilaginibacter corticis]TSJ39376.1 4-phosphopantetheinyl transferase family protein [Mucilaginibacter corticis]
MISAGNDIVALNVIDVQRTQSPAFYSKFITPTEFDLYNPNEITLINFVWLIWSAKESAYKYLKRINPELIFAPAKIKVVSLDIVVSLKTENVHNYRGWILAEDMSLPFLSVTRPEFISTVITQGDVKWNFLKIEASDYENQSKAVRSLLLNDLKISNVSVEKHPTGYPVLMKDGQELNIAVSFAHHGCYVSYSFQISE